MGMRLIYLLLVGGVCALPAGYSPEEAIKTEFELTLYDLQDDFDRWTEAVKEAYLKHRFEKKEILERELGASFEDTKTVLSKFSEIPADIHEKWLLLTRPGDYALPHNAFNKLVAFSNSLEKLRDSVNKSCSNVSSECVVSLQDVLDTLELSRNVSTLQMKWASWQQLLLLEKQNDFPAVLNLINNASAANEQFNVKTYWEMLAGYEDGYSVSESLWREVKPLYDKLHAFVKKRLYTYYNYTDQNFNENDTFPVFLSGSLTGDDWSSIADIILPRPYLFYDAQSFLHAKPSRRIFEHAATIAAKLGFPKLPRPFWSSSVFNHTTCPNSLLTFLEANRVEVLTCSRTSWRQYLEAHELVLRAALRSMDYEVYPLSDLRGSAFDEAVAGLGPYFAVNAMGRTGVARKRDVTGEEEQTLRLLTALRVLPKLAFHFAADKWRLAELEEPSGDVGGSWEGIRKEVQGLRGLNSTQYDFLNDAYISSNKPYLSKFLGTFLQFHIIEYFKTYIYNEGDTVFDIITEDATLFNAVKERHNNHWRDLINVNFGINDITAQPLLDYFRPLEEYLENITTEFITPPPFTAEPPSDLIVTESHRRSIISTTENISDLQSTSEVHANYTTAKPDLKAVENHTKVPQQNAGMYVGLALLAGVAIIVVIVLVRNRLRRRRKNNNNRRYET